MNEKNKDQIAIEDLCRFEKAKRILYGGDSTENINFKTANQDTGPVKRTRKSMENCT